MYVPEGTTRGGVQVGPVLLPRPGPHPRLGVHPQPAAPNVVLLAAVGHLPAALLAELLGDGADVVGLEPAATADVPEYKSVSEDELESLRNNSIQFWSNRATSF